LRQLQQVQPLVAFENNADYLALASRWRSRRSSRRSASARTRARARPAQRLHAVLGARLRAGRVASTACVAARARDPLERGSESDPDWLPSGRVLRLDSHDGPVPGPVWAAFGRALPRAPNLRAVVLEWLPRA